ncbi:hypothetical protein K461DRAFT_283143 [Myriangium duriaei CBS 260.36]|uniref:NACHT domain-containing protein n=1 Tax=Myriangium duriaei CBS 260.36 TaxID=1168546 RepID=A0A9P4IUM0_9PEZI|nr:hypothetical protein K461DRAFT_283143 [Myriangium duriaei CBS 260.36]
MNRYVANDGDVRRRDALKSTFKFIRHKRDIGVDMTDLERKQDVLQTKILIRLNKQFGHFGVSINRHTELLDNVLEKLQGCLKMIEEQNMQLDYEAKERLFQDRHRAVLDTLFFPEIVQRYEQISEAHEMTFQWIFRVEGEEKCLWNPLPAWLQSDEKMYWVSGKPGSGKSTLMRWLLGHKDTLALLKHSNEGKKVLILSHFFFSPGSSDQKTILGFGKSLLYQALKKIPRLIYALQTGPTARLTAWTVKLAIAALIDVLEAATQDGYIVLVLIDGLDECYDTAPDLLSLLDRFLNFDMLKLLISSRPHLEFQNKFRGIPCLRLQDLTRSDIRNYVGQRLQQAVSENPTTITPGELSKLIEVTTERSDGVFLWTKFAMDSVSQGICYEDPMETLLERLNELPTALEKMFAYIFSKIKPCYRETARNYFKLRIQAEKRLLVLEVVLCDTTGLLKNAKRDTTKNSLEGLTIRCDKVARRLQGIANGMLELLPFPDFTYMHKIQHPSFSLSAAKRVEFIHRSAFDYMKTLLYDVDGCHSDELIDRALTFSSISLLRLVGDPMVSFHLIETPYWIKTPHLYLSTVQYLKKYRVREAVGFNPAVFVVEMENAIEDVLAANDYNVVSSNEVQVFLQIMVRTIQNFYQTSVNWQEEEIQKSSRSVCKLVKQMSYPLEMNSFMIESGLVTLISDRLEAMTPEEATRALPSSINAFHQFQYLSDTVLPDSDDNPESSFDYLALTRFLLDLGADLHSTSFHRFDNFRIHPEVKFSLLGRTLFRTERLIATEGLDTMLELNSANLSMLELLVNHGADVVNEYIFFAFSKELYVVMNFTAFACYLSAKFAEWKSLAWSLWKKNPVVICELLIVTQHVLYDGFPLDVCFRREDVIAKTTNFTNFKDERLKARIENDQVTVLGLNAEQTDFKLGGHVVGLPCLAPLTAVMDPDRTLVCPYQPSFSDLAEFASNKTYFMKVAQVKAQEQLVTEIKKHGCVHKVLCQE